MLNLFNWLRRRVSESVISGVQDALEAIDAGNGPGVIQVPLCLPDSLRTRLTALPAPALPTNGEPDATGDEPVPTNGRRKRA